MPLRPVTGWAAAGLAWALLASAAALESTAGCTTGDPRSEAALGLFVAGGVAALAGIGISVWSSRSRRGLGAAGIATGVVLVALAAVGAVVLPLLFGVLLLGVWWIASGQARGSSRLNALLAYLASSLWFPVAAIAALWAALRCFTF